MNRMNDHLPDGRISGQQHLDALLRRYVGEPIPTVPGNLESRVWREIRARRFQPEGIAGRFASLLKEWVQWKPTYAAVAVALLIGVVMGHAGSKVATDSATPFGTQTGDSLGLAVFSAEPPAMPSTLLARQP